MLNFLKSLSKKSSAPVTQEMPRIHPEQFLKQLEWTTLRRLDGQLQGDYRTWFKGSGLELADLREYQAHDDVRHIDWNVTARMQVPYVREHQEDREMSAWFLVDLSRSNEFGSQSQTKRMLATSFVGTMARLLGRRGNRIGAMLMTGASSRVDTILPSRTGKAHLVQLLNLLLNTRTDAQTQATDLKVLLNTAKALIPQRSTIFIVSDFISEPHWEKSLGELSKSHDLIAVRLCDPIEAVLEPLGLCILEDLETGEQLFVDVNDPNFQEKYQRIAQEHTNRLITSFAQTGTDCLELSTKEPMEDALLRFMQLRKRKPAKVHPMRVAT